MLGTGRSRGISLAWLASVILATAMSGQSLADTIPPEAVDPAEQLNSYATLDQKYLPAQTAGTGEQIDLYTGSLGFMVTDVTLPGTGELPVRFARTFTIGAPGNGPENLPLADWEIAAPVITGLVSGGVHGVDTGWRVHSTTPFARCSLFANGPPPIETQYAEFSPTEYWNGYHLHVPGAGSQALLSRSSANTHIPTMSISGTSGTWPVVTANDWVATCLPSLQNGEPGEGFLIVAPDGRKFWFDHLVYRDAAKVMKPNEQARSDERIPQYAELHRWKAMLFATRVEDRHGNWVEYTYAGSKLSRIEASDGRVIDVAYTGVLVDKVIAQPLSSKPRAWTYHYTPGDLNENTTLNGVALPDDTSWAYDLENLSSAYLEFLEGSSCDLATQTATSPVAIQGSTDPLDGEVTTPAGLKVHYYLDVVERGHSYTPLQCQSESMPYSPASYYVFALDYKTATGPGLPSHTWQYGRSPPNDSWFNCGPGCPDTVWTSVTTPENDTVKYTFSNRFDATEGQLDEVDPDGLRVETRSYAAYDQGLWPDR